MGDERPGLADARLAGPRTARQARARTRSVGEDGFSILGEGKKSVPGPDQNG